MPQPLTYLELFSLALFQAFLFIYVLLFYLSILYVFVCGTIHPFRLCSYHMQQLNLSGYLLMQLLFQKMEMNWSFLCHSAQYLWTEEVKRDVADFSAHSEHEVWKKRRRALLRVSGSRIKAGESPPL